MIIGVVVDIKNNQCNRLFDYHVKESLENFIKVGQRVFVPFGRQKLMGFIVEIKSDESKTRSLKDIIELIDYEPVLSEELIELGKELAKNYYSFLIDEYQMMLPKAFKATYPKIVEFSSDAELSKELEAYLNGKNEAPLLNMDNFLDEIALLKKQGKASITNLFRSMEKPKTEKYVVILDETKAKTLKQKEILSYLIEAGSRSQLSFLINDMAYSRSTLNTLEKNGAIKFEDEEVFRNISFNQIDENKKILNHSQQSAFDEIKKHFDNYQEILLHGVCGSGKTEVYLDVIEEVVKNGQEAIILVPEISLTPQIVSRFKARFKDLVAIIHSRLSSGEKFDEWRRIKNGQAKIVVGARSALFVPMSNLGVIIMDEEQEGSYVQDTNPKYDSHFVASFRAKYHNIPVILGSATPSVNTYYKAKSGKIKLLEIKNRVTNIPLPKANVVDMRAELKQGNKSVLSTELKSALKETLKNNEQAVLLINRRGYSTFVMCRSCGEEIKCPHCDVTLTYHKYNDSLICHYCGYQVSTPKVCPKCESPYIRFVGDGTQKVEEEITKLLPEARLIRMDSDSIKGKNSHNDLIQSFLNHEADILLGTQVVAKGLDFPLVSLVGIVNADLGLKYPFYDALEKSYDLIEQASGRAGRKDTASNIIIQTYDPENETIVSASVHDYNSFYNQEIRRRKLMNNPPFKDVIELVISSTDLSQALSESHKASELIKLKEPNAIVLGPTKYYIFKMKDRYHYQIIIKLDDNKTLEVLDYLNERFQSLKDVYLSITRM